MKEEESNNIIPGIGIREQFDLKFSQPYTPFSIEDLETMLLKLSSNEELKTNYFVSKKYPRRKLS